MDSPLAQQLALLNQNDKLLNDLYHNYAVSVELSDTALWILYIALQGDGCTQSEICEMWSYPKQTVNTSLKNLERQGYITLLPLSGNRKSKQVTLTDHRKSIRPEDHPSAAGSRNRFLRSVKRTGAC